MVLRIVYYPEIFGNEEKIIRFDKAYYPMPERLLFLLTHRDVWLDFFKDARRQESIGCLLYTSDAADEL